MQTIRREAMSRLSAEDLLFNWARWCHRGERVGNMDIYLSESDETPPPVMEYLAERVQALFDRLPRYEQMILIAEYPQRNIKFPGLNYHQRNDSARRWIKQTLKVDLTYRQYGLYLKMFKTRIEQEITG